jgi:hypothetical protein
MQNKYTMYIHRHTGITVSFLLQEGEICVICVITYLVMIKFVSDLRQVGGFLWVPQFPSPIKLTATIYQAITLYTILIA